MSGIVGATAPETPRAQEWYLLHTKPRNERRVLTNLRQGAVESCCPRARVQRARRGAVKSVVEPLFPGYVFVLIDLYRDYHMINNTRGVARLVSFGAAEPKPVARSVVEAFKISAHDRDDELPLISELPKAGSSVRITGGPLKGVEAIFRCAKGTDRAVLLISLLSKQHEVEVDLAMVHT